MGSLNVAESLTSSADLAKELGSPVETIAHSPASIKRLPPGSGLHKVPLLKCCDVEMLRCFAIRVYALPSET
jgi:hypothetical protein